MSFFAAKQNTDMENSKVEKVTFEQIKEEANYSSSHIAIIENMRNLESEKVVHTDSVIIALCLQGKGSININGMQHAVKANDLLICRPNIILQHGMTSIDTVFYCLCLSQDFIRALSTFSNSNWDAFFFIEQHPVIPLMDEEVSLFTHYYMLLRNRLSHPAHKFQKELLYSMVQLFQYELYNVLDRFINLNPPSYKAADKLFKQFIDLISSTYPKPRHVSWYAEQLCVTPKYLSNVCKNISGKTATDLINQYVLKDIILLLKMPGKSIKEIYNELEFPNLSFFGRYVKKHLGMSPKHYREQKK